jgi:hypothetical protein
MSDLHPAVVEVFNALIDERGGPRAFNSFQAECALAIARSMIDVHSAGPIERGRIMESVGKMMMHLPPPVKKAKDWPSMDGLSLAARARLYGQLIAGLDPDADYDDIHDFSDAGAQPSPVVRPPASAAPQHAPEAAPAPAQGADLSPIGGMSEPEFDPVVAGEVVLVPAPRADLDAPAAPSIDARKPALSDADPGPPPRDDWQPPRQRTTDPFEDPKVPVIGHLRGGYSFRGGRR